MHPGILVEFQRANPRFFAPTTQQSHHLNRLTVTQWMACEPPYRTTDYPISTFEPSKTTPTTSTTAQLQCGRVSSGNRQVEHQPNVPHEEVAELNLS